MGTEPNIFLEVMELRRALGKELPGEFGEPWEYLLNDEWSIVFNPSRSMIEYEPVGFCGMPVKIPSFSIFIWYLGILIGAATPQNHYFANAGKINKKEFIRVVRLEQEIAIDGSSFDLSSEKKRMNQELK